MAEHSPFTGEYPTKDEIITALEGIGLADYAGTIVTPPVGDTTPGQLVDKLQECKSANLSTGWPVIFKHGVRSMLEKAGVTILQVPES